MLMMVVTIVMMMVILVLTTVVMMVMLVVTMMIMLVVMIVMMVVTMVVLWARCITVQCFEGCARVHAAEARDVIQLLLGKEVRAR